MKTKNYKIKDVIKVPRFEEKYGFYTTKKRSSLMSKIKGQNTVPELMLRKALWKAGYRYWKNNTLLPGKPDIILQKFKIIIFVDGEFWHGYNWKKKKAAIKSNRNFWIPKIERNMQRDSHNNHILEGMGYKVFRFWEHEIKKNLDCCLTTIIQYIQDISGSFNP